MYNFTINKRSILKVVAATIAISSSSILFAEDSNSDDKTIVITANRIPQDINDTLAAVEIITRQDIEKIQPESITDLLTTIAGFDIVKNGGAGQSSSLFIRGANTQHTLVLIDGVRVGSATLGTKPFSSIPVAQIERIEVVKGPRAALWGSDAIGGVIQIFTRKLSTGEYSAELTVGSDNFKSGNISVGFGSDKISNTVTLSVENSDGFDVLDNSTATTEDTEQDNDGYKRVSAAIRGDYELSGKTNLDWVFQVDQGNNEFDSSFGGNETDYNNYLWNIRYSYQGEKWFSEFSVKQSRDQSISFGNGTLKSKGSIYETRRQQLNILTQYQLSEAISITGGIDHSMDDVSRSKLVQFDGSIVNYDGVERTLDSAFVSSQLTFGKLIGEFSTRYDDIEDTGSEKTFNASLGYKVLDNVIVAASRAKGFKAPSFNQLYFPNSGNPDLLSEVSYNTEFLIKAHWGTHSLTISDYENNVNQLIAYIYNPADFSFLPYNIERANLDGHEVVYQFLDGKLSHKLTIGYVDAVDLSKDFSGKPKNTQLQRRAKEQYGYELTVDLGDLSFFTQFNFHGQREDKVYGGSIEVLPSFIQVNLGATYKVNEKWNVKFKVSDFTDSDPQTILNYNSAGQQVFVTVQYLNF